MKIGSKEVREIPNLPYPWRSWCPVLCGSRPWEWSWSGLCCHRPQGDPYGAASVGESIRVSSEKIGKWVECNGCGTSRWQGGRGSELVAGKGRGNREKWGLKELCIASVAGSDSVCLPVTNGSDSAPVSDYSCLIFRHQIHTKWFFFHLFCDMKEPVSAKVLNENSFFF